MDKKISLIRMDIDGIQRILQSGVFLPNAEGGLALLRQSAFMSMMTKLRRLIYECNDRGKRIDFEDDVLKTVYKNHTGEMKNVNDVSDLIIFIRNAAVHLESQNNYLDEGSFFAFNVVVGLSPDAYNVNGVVMGCDYADDMAVWHGQQRLYLKRHALRAFEEAKKVLL